MHIYHILKITGSMLVGTMAHRTGIASPLEPDVVSQDELTRYREAIKRMGQVGSQRQC